MSLKLAAVFSLGFFFYPKDRGNTFLRKHDELLP
jgi:hypothetical protein